MSSRFTIWAERRWRCARDLTVAMSRGAFLRVKTPDGWVIAGLGQVWDWRQAASGDISCGQSGRVSDAEVAIVMTGEFGIETLRRELRRTRRDACKR